MAKYYLSYYTHGTQEKNQLEKEANDYLRSMDRYLVIEADVTKFKNQINQELANLSAKYKRSKPLKVDWSKSESQKQITLYVGSGFCYFRLLVNEYIF